MRERATWEGLTTQVQAYVRSCTACQQAKKPTQLPPGLLHPLPPPSQPWQSCSMDWLTNLPVCKGGKDAVMVVVDRFTKMVVLVPCCGTDSVATTAQRYLKHVVRRFGLQEGILSDRDPKLVSAFWNQLMTQLGTKLNMTTAAHQQANGQAEGQMKIIATALRTLPVHLRSDWLELLPHLEFAINNTPHRSTGLTPFMACLGIHPRLPVDLLTKPTAVSQPADEALARLHQLRQEAHRAILAAQVQQKLQYDKRRKTITFSVGDTVFVRTEEAPGLCKEERHLPKKLQTVWAGPYPVLEVLPRDTYRLCLPKDLKLHPDFHVSKLKACYISDLFDRDEPGSPPA